jgi:hypothetical protein
MFRVLPRGESLTTPTSSAVQSKSTTDTDADYPDNASTAIPVDTDYDTRKLAA